MRKINILKLEEQCAVADERASDVHAKVTRARIRLLKLQAKAVRAEVRARILTEKLERLSPAADL